MLKRMSNPPHYELARKANFWLPRSLTGVGERFRFRAKLIETS
jgi:hypothetical protein